MAVRSLKNSTIENFANYSSSMNAGYSFQDYELIESVFLAGAASSVTFNNLNQYATEYKHLQIRAVARFSTAGGGAGAVLARFNGDTGSNYRWHRLYAINTSMASDSNTGTSLNVGRVNAGAATANAFTGGVLDILDAYSTTKNKTIRMMSGPTTEQAIMFQSGLWLNTASLTSIELRPEADNWVAGSRFSLYGIR